MKNFFKKLSFVLAVAMVLTSITPATASAASKNFIRLNGSSKAITSVTAWIGGVTRNLDYSINGKTSGVKGTWKSSNTDAVKVDAKTGVITPVANGSAYVTFTAATGEVAKVVVKARTRAAALHVYDAADYAAGNKNVLENTTVDMKVGETKELKVTMPTSKKAQAAGSNTATYYSYPEVADSAVVSVVKNSDRAYTLTAKAAGETTVTIVANQTTEKNVRTNKYFKEASFTVKVADELAAKQTGANKITVTGSNLSDKVADYVIKRGTTVITMAEVKLNTAKTEAVLTAGASSLAAGDYTATVDKNTVEFKVETSKISSIEITSDYLVLDGAYPCTTGTVAYAVYNQFGENITKKTSNINANTTFGSTANANPSKGIIEVSGISSSYVLGATGTVVVVNTETGKSANKVVTLGSEAKASAFEILGVYNAATGKPMTITETANSKTNANAAILVKVNDQYNNAMDKIDSTQVAVNFAAGLTKMSVSMGTTYTFDELVTVDGVDYVAIPVTVPADVKAGDATLILVSKTNGATTTATVTVTNTASVHDFSVYTLDTVYNKEDVEFGYTALAADGTEIKDYATLSNTIYGVKLPDSKWSWKLNSDGTAKLVYHSNFSGLNENNKYTSDSASFEVPSSYKYTTITFNVYEESRPASIGGVYTPAQNSTFGKNMGVLDGESVAIGIQNVIIYDQYGRTINPYFVGNYTGYSVTVTSATTNNDLVTVSGSALAFSNTEAKVEFEAKPELDKLVANKYELVLKYNGNIVTGSDYDLTVTGATMNNISSFELRLDSNKLYTENQVIEINPYYNYDTMGIAVTGIATNGKAVTIPSQYFTAYGSVVTGSAISGWNMKASVMSKYLEDNKLKELDMTVRVVVDNAEGTELKETITVSNADPSVLMAFQGSTNGVAKNPAAASLSANTLLATLAGCDQYNYWGGYALGKTITNIKVIEFTSTNGSVTKNNSKAPVFSGFAAGDKMIVTYTFSSGVSTTISYVLQ